MHLCLHWMVFFIVHDIFDLAGQYTCIHDHAWPRYKCIFLETVFLAPGWSILHCVCAGSLIDLDPGPEKFGKVQPPKSWSGIWTKVQLKFNCGVLQWEGEASRSPGPDEGIDRVQKAGKECAPLSLGGDQIPVRASKYPEQLPGLAPHCLPYLCPLLSSHFRLLLQDEVYQVVECSKCFKAADEQPRSDCIRTMRPRLGDLHLSASEWYAPRCA